MPFPARTVPSPATVCPPETLAALGPLLCLHDSADPHLLAGWTRAVRVAASVSLDSDGPTESLCFFDAQGRGCWCLQRLPDSDFHAWERLMSALPIAANPWAATRLRSEKRSAHPAWRACALRLHALPGTRGGARLAAADVSLSPLGQVCARRLAGAASTLALSLPRPGWPLNQTRPASFG
jgi:hypothetical protein